MLLLRPKMLSFLNRWRRSAYSPSLAIRDALLGALSLAIIIGIYVGVRHLLAYLSNHASVLYIPPSMILGLILAALSMMLLMSSAATALGALFTAHDLELVVSSPYPRWRFYAAKVLEVALSSGWMVVFFGIPALLAFALHFQASYWFGLMSVVVLTPFMVIPSIVAIVGVSILAALVPAHRTKEIFLIIAAISAIALYAALQSTTAPNADSVLKAPDLVKSFRMVSFAHISWLPSTWAAESLGELLAPVGAPISGYMGMLYGAMIALLGIGYLVVRLTHSNAYSLARANQALRTLRWPRVGAFVRQLTPWISPPARALILKEIRTFLRDMSQAFQLMMLLGLTILYLYNFRAFGAVENLPGKSKLWWQAVLIISNLATGGFIMSAMSTRFIFPSVSLEGASFWILQTSPLSSETVCRIKFYTWYFLLGSIGSVVMASGAHAIGADYHVIAVSALSAWIICYGIAGMAIGFGSLFANFSWEHPSQLSASFGSLMFMLSATALICVNMIPTGIVLFLRTLKNFNYPISNLEWYTAIICAALLLVAINYCTAQAFLKAGARALSVR